MTKTIILWHYLMDYIIALFPTVICPQLYDCGVGLIFPPQDAPIVSDELRTNSPQAAKAVNNRWLLSII